MDFQTTQMILNKDKSIGKVLFIVEGEATEPYILCRIFEKIFGYHYTRIYRDGKRSYDKLSSTKHKNSQIVVINAKDSNISTICDKNQYLDEIFEMLMNEYDFDFEDSAVFYLWDRDFKSNTDTELIQNLLSNLGNSRDSFSYDRQGLLLLSYPCIEAFTASNFPEKTGNPFDYEFDTGKLLKKFLNDKKVNHKDINYDTILVAAEHMLKILEEMGLANFNIDDMCYTNKEVLDYQESYFNAYKAYKLLSLLSIALIDLGLLEIN